MRKKVEKSDSKTQNKIHFDIGQIKSMAALGLKKEEIAMIVGITPEGLSRILKKHPDIDQAVKAGKAISKMTLLNRMNQLSKKSTDQYRATKYLLAVMHQVVEPNIIGTSMNKKGEVENKFTFDLPAKRKEAADLFSALQED